MGRHSDRKERSKETKEERLLRKAREYVDRKEQDEAERRLREEEEPTKSSSSRRDRSYRDKEKHDRTEDEHRRRRRGDSRKKHHRREKRAYDDGSSDDSERRSGPKHDSDKRERKHRKRRHSDDERDRKEKRHKKEKGKDKENEKRSKHDRGDRPARIKVDKAKLYPLGNTFGKVPSRLLDGDQDYFAFHQHLWVYLYREEGIIFGDLTSEDARKAFQRFADRYNAGKLEEAYYDPKGLPIEVIEESKTTRHSWAFKTSQTELDRLHMLQEGVRKQTEFSASGAESKLIAKTEQSGASVDADQKQQEEVFEQRRKTPEERLNERVANRRLREHVRTAEEEFGGGKKGGRERQIEKRKEKAATIHGAARDKEDAAMGGVELNDDAIYGGSGDYQKALSRERQRKAQREHQRNIRVAELQQKEEDKQKAMLEMLGIGGVKPGQKITIAPRDDAT